MVSETPFFVESIAGSMMINAFEAQLRKHNIKPVFKNMVLRREQEDGTNVVDAFYGFEKRKQVDVEFILYLMGAILEAHEPADKKRKRERESSKPMAASRFAEPDGAPML